MKKARLTGALPSGRAALDVLHGIGLAIGAKLSRMHGDRSKGIESLTLRFTARHHAATAEGFFRSRLVSTRKPASLALSRETRGNAALSLSLWMVSTPRCFALPSQAKRQARDTFGREARAERSGLPASGSKRKVRSPRRRFGGCHVATLHFRCCLRLRSCLPASSEGPKRSLFPTGPTPSPPPPALAREKSQALHGSPAKVFHLALSFFPGACRNNLFPWGSWS